MARVNFRTGFLSAGLAAFAGVREVFAFLVFVVLALAFVVFFAFLVAMLPLRDRRIRDCYFKLRKRILTRGDAMQLLKAAIIRHA